MSGSSILRTLFAALLLIALAASVGAGVPQLINYQGRLTDDLGEPLPDTTLSMTFTIYNYPTGGAQYWTSGPREVQIVGGLFDYQLGSNVTLNDSVYAAAGPRYLEIIVVGEAIVPRTRLVSVPYAYRVGTIDGATGGSVLGNIELVDAGYSFPTTDGTAGQVMSTDGAGNLGWTSVSSGSNWSVTDSTLSTNNLWGLTKGSADNKSFGTYAYSHVNFGVACTTGYNGSNYYDITIAGGFANNARGIYSSVGGGKLNTANNSYSVVSGGQSNFASGSDNSIGGGQANRTADAYSSVGGGIYNYAVGYASTIPGGYNNEASGSNSFAVGYTNVASGSRSFAVGNRAKALHDGTFVWADNTSADFESTGGDQFLIRASAGVGINTTNPSAALDVHGEIKSSAGGFVYPDGTTQRSATPLGTVMAWLKHYPNTPSTSSEWVECNGQVLNDTQSPYHGQTIPDLNGEGRFLRGGPTSGFTGGSTTHKHTIDRKFTVGGVGALTIETADSTSTEVHLPPYYRVVWIMKVK